MRALIWVAAAWMGLSAAGAAEPAVEARGPDGSFSVVVRGRYGAEWVRVLRERAKWICETESLPHAEPPENPLEGYAVGFDWAALSRAPARGCGRRVTIIDRRARPERAWSGCEGIVPVRAFLDQLDRRCRAL